MNSSALSALSAGAEPAWPEDAIEVGRILDAWGVKGWFKVQTFASDPQALFSSKRWFLQPPLPQAGATQRRPLPPGTTVPSVLRIMQTKDHAGVLVAQAHDVSDRAGAEALGGARIFVSRASFPTAEDGEFYWVDLIGLNVLNRDAVALGTVVGLIDTGPHSVLRVMPAAAPAGAPESSEILIPFVGAYVDDVSLAERRITVDWGLDY